jgi:copper homeostasis protein
MTLVEICVDDVAGARIAERCGADRVELCSDLLEGGITPSIGLVQRTLAAVARVGVQVLIRPRGGDFRYSTDEAEVMLADIAAIRALTPPAGVRVGFVLSGLTAHGRLDRPLLARLAGACGGAPLTFSRAFDEVADADAALDELADLGFSRVLTSGGAATAVEGAEVLRRLAADRRITVLAGGGVRSPHVAELVAATGVREVHLRAPSPAGAGTRTSADEVSAVVAAVGGGPR